MKAYSAEDVRVSFCSVCGATVVASIWNHEKGLDRAPAVSRRQHMLSRCWQSIARLVLTNFERMVSFTRCALHLKANASLTSEAPRHWHGARTHDGLARDFVELVPMAVESDYFTAVVALALTRRQGLFHSYSHIRTHAPCSTTSFCIALHYALVIPMNTECSSHIRLSVRSFRDKLTSWTR